MGIIPLVFDNLELEMTFATRPLLERALERWGMDIWVAICDRTDLYKAPFTTVEATNKIKEFIPVGYTSLIQLVSRVLGDTWRKAPEYAEDGEPCPVRKVRAGVYELTSNS